MLAGEMLVRVTTHYPISYLQHLEYGHTASTDNENDSSRSTNTSFEGMAKLLSKVDKCRSDARNDILS